MLGRLRTTSIGTGHLNQIQDVHIFLLFLTDARDFTPLGHRMVATHVNHIYIPGRNPGKGMNDSQDLPLVTLSFTQGETSPETFFGIWPHQLFIVTCPRRSNTYQPPCASGTEVWREGAADPQCGGLVLKWFPQAHVLGVFSGLVALS